MDTIIERRGVRQFVKFGIVGVTSTAIDWAIFYLLNYLGLYYLLAKAISFCFSVINSFVWNRRWTFRSTEKKKTAEFGKFLFVAVVGLGINALIMYSMVDGLHTRKIVGLIFATGLVTIWNFLVNKYYTFKESQA